MSDLRSRPPWRPVDLLPVLFFGTVATLTVLSPHPLHWEPVTLGAWAVFTLLALLVIAAPSVVRLERDFLTPDYRNLPGHTLLILIVVITLFFAPGALLHPGVWVIGGLVAAVIYGLGRARRELFTPRKVLGAWMPVFISFFVYENLRWFISSLNPAVMDQALADLDLALFGVHLTVWMEPWIRPLWTEWFSLHYTLYLLYPAATGLLLYYREERQGFEDFTLAFCLCMYLGFLCYLAVPAVGPIEGLLHLYSRSTVEGMSFSEYQSAVHEKYRYIRDAFPSLHVANSLVCVLFIRRYLPRLFWIAAFCEANLIVSTVYLRMHYTIDLVAGALLAVGVFWAAPRLNRWAGVPAAAQGP